MQTYLVDVQIEGSTQHVVCGKRVTVPELALLRLIHGATSVLNIRSPEAAVDYIEDEERDRLRALYDPKASEEPSSSRMAALFGLTGRLPATLKDIGIDARAAAKEAEAQAKALQERAAELNAEIDADEANAEADADAEAEAFS